ncbi:hypothetical protein [Flavobacterium sp.]
MAWALSVNLIPAFHSNLFSITSGLNPKQLKKGFPFQSGLKEKPF